MYAVPDLDTGLAWAQSVFDAAPAHGGAHVGLGTRNALLSLGETYLELIAPDPAQDLTGTNGERFAALAAPGLVTWAACGDLSHAAEVLGARQIETSGPRRTRRATPDGGMLEWDLLFHRAAELGGLLPFGIDWLECAHPATTNPRGGTLQQVRISTPDAAELGAILAAMRIDVQVSSGERAFEVDVAAGGGIVTLAGTAETLGVGFGR